MIGDDSQECHAYSTRANGEAHEKARSDAEVPRQEVLSHHHRDGEGGDENHAEKGHHDKEGIALRQQNQREEQGASELQP